MGHSVLPLVHRSRCERKRVHTDNRWSQQGGEVRHRHRYGNSVHLEWLHDWRELLRCPCGMLWIRAALNKETKCK